MSSATAEPAVTHRTPTPEVRDETIELHGHRVSYKIAGEGPVVGLIHGITENADSWRDVMPRLARHYTVIAGDLLGHGRSAKPRGDYSLGAYASGMRDLMGALGFERGTVVGRSLGGGIAMQFAYQFPEYTERMVLVSSGGLGREVHPLLRAATLPGAELVLPLIAPGWVVSAGEAAGQALGKLGLHVRSDIAEMARGLRLAQRLGGARGIPAHAEGRRRARWPARQRARPAVPRGGHPRPAAVGLQRPDHPGGPRPGGARADPQQPLRGVRGLRPLAAARRPRAVRGHPHRLHRDHGALRVRPRADEGSAARGAGRNLQPDRT